MRKSTRTRNSAIDVVEILPQPKQWIGFAILGVLIRLRAELFVASVLLITYLWVDSFGNPVITGVVLLGVPAVLVVVPHTRRFFLARAWCVLDRHRLRACLKRTKIRTMNRDGQLPWMLWARPTKTGERIWLWLPAGSASSDLENALEYVAPACFAYGAKLHRPKKITTFIAMDIVRRDPLAAKKPVSSPLSRLTGDRRADAEPGEITPISAAKVAVDGIPQPREAETKPAKTTASKPAANAATVVNGEDLSDYVD